MSTRRNESDATGPKWQADRPKMTRGFHGRSHKSHFVWKFTGKMPDRVARGQRFVRASTVEIHTDISQEPCCVEIERKNAQRDGYHLDWTPGSNTYRRNPSVWPHCLGEKSMFHFSGTLGMNCMLLLPRLRSRGVRLLTSGSQGHLGWPFWWQIYLWWLDHSGQVRSVCTGNVHTIQLMDMHDYRMCIEGRKLLDAGTPMFKTRRTFPERESNMFG